MNDYKENIIIVLLIILITVCTYGISKIPAPMNQQDDVKMQQEINDLKQDLQKLTHPQTIQARTMDWIHERGEFEKKGDGKNENKT